MEREEISFEKKKEKPTQFEFLHHRTSPGNKLQKWELFNKSHYISDNPELRPAAWKLQFHIIFCPASFFAFACITLPKLIVMGKKAALSANVLDVEEGGRHEADQMGRRNKQTKTLPSSWDFFPSCRGLGHIPRTLLPTHYRWGKVVRRRRRSVGFESNLLISVIYY